MYKRLKAHASVYFPADDIGVSDYEDEDGEKYNIPKNLEMPSEYGPEIFGEEESDEELDNRNMMCRICPDKRLNSEQDVEKHLNSIGHLKSMKAYLKKVTDAEEKEAIEQEIEALEEKLKKKWKAKSNQKGERKATKKGKKAKKAKRNSDNDEDPNKKKRKRKAGDDGGENGSTEKKPPKRKRKGKNTRMRERLEREKKEEADRQTHEEALKSKSSKPRGVKKKMKGKGTLSSAERKTSRQKKSPKPRS
eukprot:CAMPEP_0184491868 /NCGR_PEP_ID=MMETSP0113_2-20130426/21570_1 /TAXON_ID=91329 /ORGANISM="Norrisiella sphaerica, Strain BC52" /LENGTH=248 /DNA_ID=CAMNT_0026876411 /DNA_START=101 /DNA_END=847 /DNA_ORIENTATION=+